jgi:electron-transferring-flavoprotein dehydrogenase
LAAEGIFGTIEKNESNPVLYQNLFEKSWLYEELYKERNVSNYHKVKIKIFYKY